jgi:hypothetical protein
MIHKPKDNPIPTSRDAIDSWLDVLVSMLSLPATNKAQVRDELEDHLRSRVDDLLVMGTTEREAIQTAINELGETAELAKLISSATRTRTPFRRFAMNAVFFVLAGSVLTASVSMMIPTNGNNAVAVVSESESVHTIETDSKPLSEVMLDVRSATIQDLCNAISQNTDKPLVVHWERLSDLSIDRDTPILIDADPISVELTLTILAEKTQRDLRNSIAMLTEEDRIEIGTRELFDQRTTSKRLYDLSMFTDTSEIEKTIRQHTGSVDAHAFVQQRDIHIQNRMTEMMDLVHGHVSTSDWRSLGGSVASLSVLKTTMIITAPTRIHEEVELLLNDLRKQFEVQKIEQLHKAERSHQQLENEYKRIKEHYLNQTLEVGHIESRFKDMQNRIYDDLLSDEDRSKAKSETEMLALRLKELRLELEEQERRYVDLQTMLIDAERQLLLNGMR